MSYSAEKWARSQKTGNARAKQVLIELANCLNEETGLCCPSRDYLREVTELKTETISNATAHLEKIGLIEKRREPCKKGICIHYTLIGYINPKTGYTQKRDKPENGLNPISEEGEPENGLTGEPENGLVTDKDNKELEQINKEKKKKEKTAVAQKRGTTFSLETIPDEWIEAAEKLDPEIDARKLFDDFADYWRSVPGEKGRKKDWLATWRNSVRSIPDWKRKNFLKSKASMTSKAHDSFMDPNYWANETDEMI